ncbi:hypothetical protein SAMN05444745_1295 [Arthrobacter sp. OV608]|nr:hypothetical protein SAMN05444745_1295 [Arthrobacter sp. OV608]
MTDPKELGILAQHSLMASLFLSFIEEAGFG